MNEVSETLGQRLRAERERKGLSVQKAADGLHLDPWVVDALENGDYALVGPAVYVKGHLKRYAELLGLPPADMLDSYPAQSPAPPLPTPAVTLRMRTSAAVGSQLPWVQISGFLAVAAIIGGALGWRAWHTRTAATQSAAKPSVEVPSAVPTAGQNTQPDDPSGAGIDAAAVSSAGTGVTVAAPLPPPAGGAAVPATVTPVGQGNSDPMAGAGRARLRMSFSADSWVDVHDAAGQRVYAGNGRANSVKTIAGAAPLRVYLKSAGGVQLEINNHPVAIGPQFVAGGAAHFAAGADGVLRRDAHAASVSGAAAAPRPRG